MNGQVNPFLVKYLDESDYWRTTAYYDNIFTLFGVGQSFKERVGMNDRYNNILNRKNIYIEAFEGRSNYPERRYTKK